MCKPSTIVIFLVDEIFLAGGKSFLQVAETHFEVLDIHILHYEPELVLMHETVDVGALFDEAGTQAWTLVRFQWTYDVENKRV